MSCHAGLLEPFGPTMFVPTEDNAEYAAAGVHLSPYGGWRWTPMGLAGRDPIFVAQLESEIELMRSDFSDEPEQAELHINDLVETCLNCHGAMGKHQYRLDHGAEAASFGVDHIMRSSTDAFLDVLDKRMEASGLFYVRFMDDWVILAPTRWKLRNAVRIVNQTLAELQVEQHPDKTFVGSTNRGFSCLGYEFNADGLTGIAEPTSARFVERIRQLYEQGASVARIGDYIRRWLIWVRSGLDEQVNFGVPALAFSNLANLARLIPHKEMH